jgi:hypothetical protein
LAAPVRSCTAAYVILVVVGKVDLADTGGDGISLSALTGHAIPKEKGGLPVRLISWWVELHLRAAVEMKAVANGKLSMSTGIDPVGTGAHGQIDLYGLTQQNEQGRPPRKVAAPAQLPASAYWLWVRLISLT